MYKTSAKSCRRSSAQDPVLHILDQRRIHAVSVSQQQQQFVVLEDSRVVLQCSYIA